MKNTLGNHVEQKGSRVSSENFRFDFSHFSKLDRKDIVAVENFVNSRIENAIDLEEDRNVPIKKALSDGDSFYKLIIKEKKEIVAYGVPDDSYDMNIIGEYLNAEQFNKAIDEGNTAVIDMRNFYETEVGRFKNAEIPKVEKSKDLLPEVRRMLNGRENHKVLLYCTGGIRCEKASVYLEKKGFTNVYQLKGGILNYLKKTNQKKS